MSEFETENWNEPIHERERELTKIQREYVLKLYKREKGEHGTDTRRYRSVVFGKYEFQPGDDPFDLSRDWPISEKPGGAKVV